MVFQLQIYISTCILFVATALFEYCYIIAMLRFPGVDMKDTFTEDGQNNNRKIMEKKFATGRSIDIQCIVLLTMLFAGFNIIYFVTICK